MSINMDTSGDTDYSDFEYQQVVSKTQIDGDAGNASVTGKGSVEPLQGIGGLANNEVAELVYMETIAHVEHDDETGTQGVGNETEFRGVVGSNLEASASQFPNDAQPSGQTTEIDFSGAFNGKSLNINTLSEDRIFQMFRASGAPGFDDKGSGIDTGGGLGGGASHTLFHAEKAFRELTGRGPVLDQSDNLDVLSKVILGDSNVSTEGSVRVHCVWDVAEVSDAGRAFSVPM